MIEGGRHSRGGTGRCRGGSGGCVAGSVRRTLDGEAGRFVVDLASIPEVDFAQFECWNKTIYSTHVTLIARRV